MACILQDRHPLKPYRNRGFRWLSDFEELLPISGATGSSAYTPSSSSIPPPSSFVPPLSPSTSSVHASVLSGGFVAPAQPHGSDRGSAMTAASSTMRIAATTTGDEMDIDTAVGSSLSFSKRKHSDILHGDDNGHTHTFSDNSFHFDAVPHSSVSNPRSLPISSAPSAPSAPSVSVSSASFHNSAKKKKTTLTHNSASHVSSSAAPSGNIAMKITPAVAIHGMQGTLNRLTHIMEQAVVPANRPLPIPAATPTTSLRTQAITLIQTRNDSLSISNKKKLIRVFTKEMELAEVYVALEDDELRQDWLHDMLMAREDSDM